MGRALGGLPRLARAGSRAVARPNATPMLPANSRARMNDLLRRKGFWLGDVDDHPMVLGVPVGRDGPQGSVSVDLGMKKMAWASMSDIVDASPQMKQKLLDQATPLHTPLPSPAEALARDAAALREAPAVPMKVVVKEDLQLIPVANPVRPPPQPCAVPCPSHVVRFWLSDRGSRRGAGPPRRAGDEDVSPTAANAAGPLLPRPGQCRPRRRCCGRRAGCGPTCSGKEGALEGEGAGQARGERAAQQLGTASRQVEWGKPLADGGVCWRGTAQISDYSAVGYMSQCGAGVAVWLQSARLLRATPPSRRMPTGAASLK